MPGLVATRVRVVGCFFFTTFVPTLRAGFFATDVLTRLGSTRGVSLTLTRLRDQVPKTGLQRWPTAGITQATTGELLSLRRIALGQAYFGQAIEHLRLARRNTLSALQA